MKKRVLSFIICFAMFVSILPNIVFSASAAESYECGDNLVWNINNDGVLTVLGTGKMYDFTIKSRPWHYKRAEIRKVIVANSAVSIGKHAFNRCDRLFDVYIHDSVTSIGDYAFYACWQLKYVQIPNSVTNIGEDAFGDCPDVVIHCNKNSVAHRYAVENNIKYQLYEGSSDPTTTKYEMTFTDVPTNAWYYEDLKSAYDAGIINGKTANEFKPNDNMTYAEAIKLAACLHQKATTGKVTLENGNPWYQPYVDYCKAHGIIDKEYNYNASATRAGYMMIFANALPDEYLPAINTVYDNSIPDVRMSDPYARSVYKLYRAGIVGGSDQKHNCKPFDNIKRSEVATILARMMFAEKRIEFTLGDVPESQYPYDEPEDTGAEEKEKNEKEPTGLRLDYNKTTLAIGEVDYWTATVYPDDANPSVTWSSANTTVATVDQNGKVTAISPGEARITVITENGLKEAITVTVVAK